MNPQIVSLFGVLADLNPEQRTEYLNEHNVLPDLRLEVEALLRADGDQKCRLHNIVQEAVGASFQAGEEQPVGEVCGPYRLLRLIGRGGMGLVYLAQRADGELRQQVAVKLLRAGMDSDGARHRFLQERQILADLAHPNIARLLDAGHHDDGQPYLVMEYIDGQPIDEYAGQLPIRSRVELFAIVCDAVSYAHQKLVIHRDLKPNNIMVGYDGTPKLLDFGIAKLIDVTGDATMTLERRLTPSYASPEQVRGQTAGTATDIYSLGAVLYKLLTGQESFPVRSGMALAEMESAICEKNPPKPSEWNNKIDRDLDAIVLKAMRKEPGERYATADRLAEDLRAWLEGLPVRARQGGWWYVARRQLRRYWAPVIAGVAAVAGLTAGLVLTLHERDIAQRRFMEVRGLAGQMLKVERDIENLPGATPARERIVKISLDYLERLSKDAGSDVDLNTEIAVAYRTIAGIQGGFRRANLGRPADARVSLRKAEKFFRVALAANPNDEKALSNLVGTLDTQARIDYGQHQGEDLEKRIDELQGLTARYERVARPTPATLARLSTIYDDLALEANGVDRTDQALEFAGRSLAYQRRLVAVQNTQESRGDLSASLSSYARILQAEGNLDAALPILRESSALLEEIGRNRKDDFLVPVNMGAMCSEMAGLLGEEDRIISLGKYGEGVQWYERALKYDRTAVRMGPQENQARSNAAEAAWHLGNIVRHTDAARALAAYDEAIDLLRGMPEKMVSRDVPLSFVLSESTFPLRQLRRDDEARKRLNEARQIAVAYQDPTDESLDVPSEAIMRADAAWASASGRPGEAVAVYLRWLQNVNFGQKNVQRSLGDALLVARCYQLLGRAYEIAGQAGPAADARAKRKEVLEIWRNKAPSRKFVEQLLGAT